MSNLGDLWIRDINGISTKVDRIWIRHQGSTPEINKIWVRDEGGNPILVYPNVPEASDETTLVVMNRGFSQQLPSLQFDANFPPQGNNPPASLSIEDGYRSLGVEFGLIPSVGNNLGNGTLLQAAQLALTPAATEIGLSSFVYNWWGFNMLSNEATQAVLRGGRGSTQVVPTNYTYLKRNITPSANVQQVLNTVFHYYPTATSTTLTYGQLHDSCLRAYEDIATWMKTHMPTLKNMNWWKTAVSPVPLGEDGWWNNPSPTLDSDGTPPNGVSTIHQQAESNMRTITGSTMFGVSGTSIVSQSSSWTSGFSSYPVGTFQARAHASSDEMTLNSSGIDSNYNCLVHESRFPLYPPERNLHTIPNSGYTSIPLNITYGYNTNGTRYSTWSNAQTALYQSTRLNWFANWKRYGFRASVGMDLACDLAEFPENRWSGLATTNINLQGAFDQTQGILPAILNKVTNEEALRYGLPLSVVNKRLIPRYWVFWNNGWSYLWNLMSHSSGDGRGNFSSSVNPNALLRARANLEWRFPLESGPTPKGLPSGGVDWNEGSFWHNHLCRQLDLFGISRCAAVKEFIDIARNDP